MKKSNKWMYAITTVPHREFNYFEKTLESLNKAGWDKPIISVDDNKGYEQYESTYTVIKRERNLGAFGHWYLTMLEMWIRDPNADWYAIFQDDFTCYRNLRQYIDLFPIPENQYWNLYTFPQNEDLCGGKTGWHKSNQRGRGGVALIFPRNVVFRLLSSEIMVAKSKCPKNPTKSLDGAIINSFSRMKPVVTEFVHYPTLVQHLGTCTSIGNRQWDKPRSWMGEDFDAMEFYYAAASTAPQH